MLLEGKSSRTMDRSVRSFRSKMEELYNQGFTPQEIATKLNLPLKSVISTLSRRGLYKASPYKPKYGDEVVYKEDLAHEITKYLPIEDKVGLARATKPALMELLKCLKELNLPKHL